MADMPSAVRPLVCTVLLLAAAAASPGVRSSAQQAPEDDLARGFEKPPDAAKPRVWWHWMNGNITKEGIKLDLEWMHRVGIGGFQNFDASLFPDKVVEKRLVYMTPEWKDAFQYATPAGGPTRARRGHRRIARMERVGRSVGRARAGDEEARVERDAGHRRPAVHRGAGEATHDSGPLPERAAHRPGRGVERSEAASRGPSTTRTSPSSPIAGCLRATCRWPTLRPLITSSAGTIDPSLLWDGDLVKSAALPMPPPGEKAWIQFAFAHPLAIRGVSLAHWPASSCPFGPPPAGPDLEASDDGRTFRKVANIPRSPAEQNTVSFAPVPARYFRVTFVTSPPPRRWRFDLPLPPPAKDHQIAEFVLHTGARVNRFEEKAAFVPLAGLSDLPTPRDRRGRCAGERRHR